MQPNATELNVPPRLATRNEANQGQLVYRVGVNGVPNEATLASFPASMIGVNEAKQGQIGPGGHPPSPFPCRWEPHIPGPIATVYERNERK